MKATLAQRSLTHSLTHTHARTRARIRLIHGAVMRTHTHTHTDTHTRFLPNNFRDTTSQTFTDHVLARLLTCEFRVCGVRWAVGVIVAAAVVACALKQG